MIIHKSTKPYQLESWISVFVRAVAGAGSPDQPDHISHLDALTTMTTGSTTLAPLPVSQQTSLHHLEPKAPPIKGYDGTLETWQSFLTLCSLTFELQLLTSPSNGLRYPSLLRISRDKQANGLLQNEGYVL